MRLTTRTIEESHEPHYSDKHVSKDGMRLRTPDVGCSHRGMRPWKWGPLLPESPSDSYPPDGYIATTEPVYYEGHATYWYGGNWYYRDGNRWSHYDREPPALQQRRMQAAPVRRSYTPSGTSPVANAAGHPQERARGER